MADASRYGTICGDPSGRLSGFREKQPGAGTISAGIYLFKPRLLDEFPAKRPLSFESDVFPSWLERGINLRMFEADMPFLDIGTPESLPLAESFVRKNTRWFPTATDR
jgi:NDP-sugar pyrophosphorylase family protein